MEKPNFVPNFQHFPKLFDQRTQFQVTLLKNGLTPERFSNGKIPSKSDILVQLPQHPIKLEPEIIIKEGPELIFPPENVPEPKNPRIEITSKEVVVHKDFKELKKKVAPPPITIVGKI